MLDRMRQKDYLHVVVMELMKWRMIKVENQEGQVSNKT